MTTTRRHNAHFIGGDARRMHELILRGMDTGQRVFLDPMPDGTYAEVIRRADYWKVAFGTTWPDPTGTGTWTAAATATAPTRSGPSSTGTTTLPAGSFAAHPPPMWWRSPWGGLL